MAMDAEHNRQGANRPVPGPLHRVADRRTFLQWSGAAAATALVVACDDAPTESTPTPNLETAAATSAGAVTINLSNDFGILNFAYALEQLEAA
ncbi:MAG: ferritin-like domain-containing protein, partial [Gemmatimonadota bacterium]|nr:ferritin-like domain-containing protein [Gemmatimonadota bacterium]